MNPEVTPSTFIRFLSGLSRTLGVANQVIPLYQQTKPLFKNAKSAYTLIKDINKPGLIKNILPTKTTPTAEIPKEKATQNSPQFFI